MSYSVDTIELKKVMIEKNINTIQQLSDVSGVSRNTISKVLNGRIRPSSNVMERLAMALDIEPSRAGVIFFKINLRNS